ncbi:MAG: hypothetical protein QGH83_09235 [Candidatus Pacebacteria bacterium]|jgi:hypothetical protein|nr:hypothetical protein [Candidatus Paceibacterota bacterium]|tara:strand:+ start:439 stop:978 length:540 start_codon:yes stop_codon:yes gene_type:complete
MKTLPYTKLMVGEAQDWASSLGGLKNSITGGRGNAAGRLGELALAKHLGVKLADEKDYDMVYNGEKIEVKTKRRTVPPKGFYDVSVAKTSTHQHPDRYVFISMEFEDSGYYGKPAQGLTRRGGKWYKNLKDVWLCGDMSAKEFFQRAKLWQEGTTDESNDFTTLTTMYNLSVDELHETF